MFQVIFVILVIIIPAVSMAQEPSMEDTIAWVHQNVPDITIQWKGKDEEAKYGFESLEIDDANGRTFMDYGLLGKNTRYGYLDELSLDVKYSSYTNVINSDTKKKVFFVRLKCRSRKCLGFDERDHVDIMVSTRDMARRVATAFEHLINLSGGKEAVSDKLF